ncbi:Sterol 3-beta-glucosyltransferase, partial [Oleoguttula sp. CCFEE 5521]
MSQSTTLSDRRSASAVRLQQGRRKLVKKRYDRLPGMAQSSIALPARFEEVDEEEEIAARRADEAVAQSSVYGLFAQARRDGTGFGLGARSREGSRQSVDEGREGIDERRASTDESVAEQASTMGEKKAESKGHRKRFSVTNLGRSILKPIRERSDSTPQNMTQSQILLPKEELGSLPERPGSRDEQPDGSDIALDRKLQAQAKAEMEDSASTIAGRSRASTRTRDAKAVLAEIFHFDKPEDVVAQYPCFYVQTVLLHGDFYITTKHICFYAYLPRKDSIVKSGNISKKGKSDPRYARRWFVLKGDVLNYYKDAAHPYEPVNGINLRYAITAELTPEKGKGKETTYFTIVTSDRTYYLRADSATSAKEWVKQLQKVIFRSHNDGDSVKISLPISNIVEVESNPIVGNHDTVNLHVIDNNEDFAIDEYLFTFTTHGQAALSVLNEFTHDNESRLVMEGSDEDVQPNSHLQTPGIRRSLSIGRSRSPRMLHLQPGNVQEQ